MAEKKLSTGEKAAVGVGGALVAGKLAAKTGALSKAGGALKALKALKAGGSGGAVPIYNEDWKKGALYSGLGSAGGTALIGLLSGNPAAITGIGSAMAGIKGATMGGLMSGGRDTLFKNTAVPAAVIAASAPLTNYALDVGYNDSHSGENWQVDVPTSIGITTALGGGLWALRNWRNKNKQWI